MRFAFFLLMTMNFTLLSAQKTHRKVNHNNLFPYSYKCSRRDYVADSELLYVTTKLERNDSILLYIRLNTDSVQGKISFDYNSAHVEKKVVNSVVELHFPKKSTIELINVLVQYEDYKEETILVRLSWNEENEYYVIDKQSIFNSKNRHIIVHSSSILSYSDLEEIVDCLPIDRMKENNCFDPQKIQIQYQH